MSFIRAIVARGRGNAGGAMSVTDHIEDLRWHIIRSLLMVIVSSMAVFFRIEWIFDRVVLGPAHTDFVSYRIMCYLGRLMHIDGLCMKEIRIQFQNTELSGQFMMSFSSSFIIGFIIASPYVFWELWRFVKPALKPGEAIATRGVVLWASVLFFTGVLFAYFVVVPFTVNFFAAYQLSPSFQNIITMTNYYDTLNDMILGMGLVFELPVAVYFLSRIGVLTPRLMREKRNYAIIVVLVLSAVITPPDWLSIWLVAIPLMLLYELSIKISGRVAPSRSK